MSKLIFVNLPVTELARSTAFYEALGATKNPQLSDAAASCMVFSEAIHVMLLTHEKFMQFSPRPIGDAKAMCQVLLCLSAESRAEVDRLIVAAASHGGRADVNAPDEHGFMYGRSVEDPDGHLLQVMWMDVEAAKAAMAGCQAA